MTTIIHSVEIPNEHLAVVKTRIINGMKRYIADCVDKSWFGWKPLNYDNKYVIMLIDKVAMHIIEYTLGPKSVFNEMVDENMTPQELWDELYGYPNVEYEFVTMFVDAMKHLVDQIPGAYLE
jgi:hypothetical protein